MVFFALYRKKVINRFQRQLYKLVKHTRQQQIAGELFECVWPFCWVGA